MTMFLLQLYRINCFFLGSFFISISISDSTGSSISTWACAGTFPFISISGSTSTFPWASACTSA